MLSWQKKLVDPDDIETLQDLIVAAVNEAMRQVDEASSRVNGQISRWFRRQPWWSWRRLSVLMDFYSKTVNQLIEELSKTAWDWSKISSASGISYY